MNMNKDILNKIRVISTSLDSRSNFVWPDECWVVGASNSNFGSDSFEVHYLYKPHWTTHMNNSYGGYLEMKDDGECSGWWTFNYVFSQIQTDYLYICEDRETAKEWAKYLNSFPNKSIDHIDSDIDIINDKINVLKEKIKMLEESKKFVELIKEKVENGKGSVG